MVSYSNHILAQNNTSVPEMVAASFAKKYPAAEVKKWNSSNNKFTAVAKEHGHKCLVTFDQKGNWLNTTTKVNWPWKLPQVVKAAFKKSEYKNWNMYSVRIIDKPTGQFYQILVDDRNHPVDIFHQNLVTEKRKVEIKSNGDIVNQTEDTENVSL